MTRILPFTRQQIVIQIFAVGMGVPQMNALFWKTLKGTIINFGMKKLDH